uniref:DEAD/DEAH box helicase n=1 Tax=Prevotella sp. TaxID=59823 RepID=UPI004024D95C
MRFEELDLSDNVLDALYDMRFEECTPVQEKCIPEILNGRDVLGVAQTGTGKTAAYLLPVLSKLDDGGYPKNAVNCVIMSPTRELAQQIDQTMQGFAYYTPGVSSVAVYGGNDGNRYDQELKSMKSGVDVIIATPGRLISHISLGNVDLGKVSFFVLDEADRMLDMGFSDDIMKIASQLPKTCQTIMFSATMPKDIEKLAQSLLKDPVEVKLAVSKPAEKIQQSAYICYETQKLKIIEDIFKAGDLKRVIIFSGSKQKVKHINQALTRLHINSGEMHSDLDQAERDDMMFKFKSGQIDVLVATDILARGIDIDDIAMVINYDVPHDAEDYVHRIGRTARADRDGVAITLVNEDDMYAFHQIEKFLDKDIRKNPLPEGCGEDPEYTISKRNGKTSAKSRRRKDRDNTAHKDTKRANRNAQNPQGAQGGQHDDRRNNRNKDRRNSDNRNRDNRNGESRINEARNGEIRSGEERQGQERNRNNRRQRGPKGEGRNPQSGNKQDYRKKGAQGNKPKPKNRPQQQPAAQPAATQDKGIGSVLRHPLRWLRSLGRRK